MVLKLAKYDLNGVKIAIFVANGKNHSAAGGSAPYVTTVKLQRLAQHGT